MQKTCVKTTTKFTTDVDIVLECLYEVYQQEGNLYLSKKDIRRTMVYPFLKMLERMPDYEEKVNYRKLHQNLWNVFLHSMSMKEFVEQAQNFLKTL